MSEHLGIPGEGEVAPAGKLGALATLKAAGHRPLMVGDGLNDTAALTAAHASIYNHFNHDRHLNRRDIFKQN